MSGEGAAGIRRGRLVAWGALLLAAAVLRAWAVTALGADWRISRPLLDAQHYLETGRRLAAGEGWPAGAHFFGPLYPWLLGLLFRAAPPEPSTVQVAQSLLGLATLAVLLCAARRWFGDRAALATGLLYLFYGPILAMESQVLMEPLLLLLCAAALWLWPAPGDRPWRAVLFGVACGLLVAGRGSFLLLPAAWALNDLRVRRREGLRGPRVAATAWVLVAAGLVLPLLPQTLAQTRAVGRLQVLTLNGGMNLFIGNNPAAQGIFSMPPGLDLHEDVTGTRSASLLARRPLTTADASRFWAERAAEFVRAEPLRAARLLGKKALLFFSPHEVPQIDDFQRLAEDALPLRAAFLRFAWILPLAVCGLVRLVRGGRASAAWPWLLLVGVGWAQTVVFFATGRYRLPVMAGLLGLAGLGLAELAAAARQRRAWRAPLAVAGATALLAVAPPGYPVRKARYFDAYMLGKRHNQAANHLQAVAAYDRAAALWPEAFEVWHDRGAALYRLGRHAEAAESYARALERAPSSAVTWYALGAARFQQGDAAGAVAALERAVALSPTQSRYRIDLGTALAAVGRDEEAAAQWREVLRAEPHNEEARSLLERGGAARP